MIKNLIILILLFCNSRNAVAQEPTLFSSLPSSYTGIRFSNTLYEDETINFYSYGYLYNGAGVAIGDINNDGLPDIYFSSTTGFNKLYLNLGNLRFRDITEEAGVKGELGVKTGVNMFDINQDGWLDIIVSRAGPFQPSFRKKLVYINNGKLGFTERGKEMGLDDASFTTQTYFLDYDRDGDMDAFLVNHPISFNNTMVLNGKMVNGKLVAIDDTARQYVSHRLYENRNGRYTDVSKKAGISTYAFGLSAGMADFNQDGWPDIYVANDFRKPDYLYINNRNGSFSEKLKEYFAHTSLSSMGMDINDINNDGWEDVFVADMALEDPVRQKRLFVQNQNYDRFQLMVRYGFYFQYPHNTLQLNNGNGSFSEIAYHAGVAETDWSWAPIIADFDNDGKKDIYVTNGFRRDITDWDYKEFFVDSINTRMVKGQKVTVAEMYSKIPSQKITNYFFRNNGSLQFDNYSTRWSDAPPSFSNGAAVADLDNDGDLDLVVNNIDEEAFVLRNNLDQTAGKKFLRFRFFKTREGRDECYGTTVKITDEQGHVQFQRFDPQRGFMSSHEHVLHFGTGENNIIPEVLVTFPSGKTLRLSNIATGQQLNLFESDAAVAIPAADKPARPVFSLLATSQSLPFTHTENSFIDFKREPLIPYQCSRKGPYYAMADLNGDQREDLFIGASAGNTASLFLQQTDGSFKLQLQEAFRQDSKQEDGAAFFLDADQDGDLDLYVTSGGAEFPAGSMLYQDRLYMNDGKGNFSRNPAAIPVESSHSQFALQLDFDGDGDPDIFSGGAVLPGQFPKKDRSLLLQNNKGLFADVSGLMAGLPDQGIINAGVWGNLDSDPQKELILAGEWMPITAMAWTGEKFEKKKYRVSYQGHERSMDELKGWWNCIRLVDIDQDGDMDLLAGNRGLNSRIRASLDKPCMIYAKDFDGNGSYDALLGYYIGDKCYPMYHRDQLIDQMPFIRKKFYRYHLYAGKTMDEIFTAEQKARMDTYTANCFESGLFLNNGNGSFQFIPFPEKAQLSNINDIITGDWNKDGITDLLVAGNSGDPDVSTGNYDAMAALLLEGTGKGAFRAIPHSGLNLRGEIRRIVPIGKNRLVLLKNNEAAVTVGF